MRINIQNIIRYEFFIVVGLMVVIGTLIKLLGVYDFSLDWSWFVAGISLTIESLISLSKQRKFDRKFKIVGREQTQKL